jgi:aspartyl-tRNA(Asn)/glutamyl-tRNA(Gln) amidotransferase subunit C
MLSRDEVKKIGQLARISLTDEEIEQLQKDLSVILDYVDALKQVDTEGLVEVSQVTGLENVQRADEPEDSPIIDDIFKNAPDIKDGYYKVKAIL